MKWNDANTRENSGLNRTFPSRSRYLRAPYDRRNVIWLHWGRSGWMKVSQPGIHRTVFRPERVPGSILNQLLVFLTLLVWRVTRTEKRRNVTPPAPPSPYRPPLNPLRIFICARERSEWMDIEKEYRKFAWLSWKKTNRYFSLLHNTGKSYLKIEICTGEGKLQ